MKKPIELLKELKHLINNLAAEKQVVMFNSEEMSERCKNILISKKIQTPKDILKYKNIDILNWVNFGKKSINDLLKSIKIIESLNIRYLNPAVAFDEWVGDFLKNHPINASIFDEYNIIDESTYLKFKKKLDNKTLYVADNFRYNYLFKYIDNKNPIELLKICPSWVLDMEIKNFRCNKRLRNFISTSKILILQDFEKINIKELLKLPGISKKSISDLAEQIHKIKLKGQPPSKENVTVLYKNLGAAFKIGLDKIKKSRDRSILKQRLGACGSIKTLEEIAKQFDVTRERIRQIQKTSIKKMLFGEFWQDYLNSIIVLIMKEAKSPIELSNLKTLNPWLSVSGFKDNVQLFKSIINYYIKTDINFLEYEGKDILSYIHKDKWVEIKSDILSGLEHSIDVQYTIEDIEMMIEYKLSEYDSQALTSQLFDEIFPYLNFSDYGTDLVLSSIGNTITSHLIAILNEEEKPIHYSEIRDLYEKKYGVNVKERNIHAKLNRSDFLLFDRGIYGTRKHITLPEHEQKHILQKAEYYLEKNKNRQCHSHSILKSIHVQSIDKYMLNIILQKSKKATYLGKLVWVFGNNYEENQRLPIKETIASILKAKNRPMQILELQKEISKVRSVGKYFTGNLQPNELFSRTDPQTWGLLERDFVLPEKDWRQIKNLIEKYLLKTNKALHTSELSKIIHNISLSEEITVGHIVGVLSADNRFKKWRNGFIGLFSWNSPRRYSLDESIDIVLNKYSHEPFTLDEVMEQIISVLKYKVTSNIIVTYLNKKGFTYNRNLNKWYKLENQV